MDDNERSAFDFEEEKIEQPVKAKKKNKKQLSGKWLIRYL